MLAAAAQIRARTGVVARHKAVRFPFRLYAAVRDEVRVRGAWLGSDFSRAIMFAYTEAVRSIFTGLLWWFDR